MSFLPVSFPRSHFQKVTRQKQFRVDQENPIVRQDEREIDIISIPAIGAGAEATWRTQGDEPWLVALRDGLGPARLLLYDHLTAAERALKSETSPIDYDAAQKKLADYKISDWADRFWKALMPQRDWMGYPKKPVLFICHSSGGIVLKEALTRLRPKNEPDLVELCYGIVFFATPHHGSTVLSDRKYATSIKDALGMKWELGLELSQQLAPGSHDLELLDQRFSSTSSLGVQIWNYTEEIETSLRTEDNNSVPNIIVGSVSADGTTLNSEPLDYHESRSLPVTHVDTARLTDPEEFGDLLQSVRDLTGLENLKERRHHKWLLSQISDGVNVSIHTFIPDVPARGGDFHVRSTERSLGAFLHCPEDQDSTKNYAAPETSERTVVPNQGPTLQVPRDSSRGRQRLDPADGLDVRRSRTRQHSRSARPRSAARSMSADVFVQPRNGSSESINVIAYGNSPQENAHPQGYEPLHRHVTRAKKPFTWFSIPYCVSSWVHPVMAAISHHRSLPGLHKQVLLDQLWNQHHNRSRHGSFHAQFVRPHFQALLPRHHHNTDELLSPSSATEEPQLALFFPYLHWDTFEAFKARCRVIKARSAQEDVKPISEEILSTKNLEHKLLWQHLLDSRSPMHCRRTLDQYRYPALRSTEARDWDQVLYKKTKTPDRPIPPAKHDIPSRLRARRAKFQSRQLGKSQDPPTMLTVDTLWLWVLSDEVLTFAPKRESIDEDPDLASCADLNTSILHGVTGPGKLKVDDCFDLAALVVLSCITQLLDDTDHPNLQVFKIFEEYISELTEAHTEAFKDFKDNQVRNQSGYDNRRDLHNLLELRDISDELQTIKKLIEEQHALVNTMHSKYESAINRVGKGTTGLRLLVEARKRLDIQSSQVKDMLDASTVAQASYEKLLEMKQAQSSVLEAHASREQTRVVTVFTVITIIFSPLSFFTSLFGMNVSEWSGETSNPDLYIVLKIICSVSLGVILLAMLVGFHRATRSGAVVLWDFMIDLVVRTMEYVRERARRKDKAKPRTIRPMVPNKLIPILKKAQAEKTPGKLEANGSQSG
ncbi:MAG: hypothetical protein MMC23_008896 [Stictis urceolatum]|nr:hypothetical protein [Stictis urceolata]